MIRGMGYYRDGAVATTPELSDLVGEIPGDADVARHIGELAQRCRTQEGAFAWVGLFHPTKAELAAVQEAFGLDPLQVEDAENPRQRAKFDFGEDSAFLLLKVLGYVERTSDVETGQIAVFVGPSYAITVRHGSQGDLRAVRDRLEHSPHLLRQGPACVLYAVLDSVVDGYLSVSDEITNDVEAVEESVFSPRRTDDAQAIYRLKRENLETRRAVAPLVQVAHAMVRESVPLLPPGLAPFFRDVGDHVLRANDATESNDNLLMTMLMASTGRQDLQQNSDMRKISAWVAIAAVPTAVAAIYGMNFDEMPELRWAYGYPVILLVMLVACVLLYRAFKRSGWL